MDEVRVILNPAAGRGRAARWRRRLEQLLRRIVPFSLVETREPLEAVELAREAARQGYRTVAAAGGDGTVNEVANGLVGTETCLAVIPIGNGNDFAKVVGLARRPERACVTLTRGKAHAIDVGQLEGRLFVNGLGIGFDAEVVRQLETVRVLRGMALYLAAVLKTYVKFRPPLLRVSYEGGRLEEEALLLEVGNGISAGGGFYLTPEAKTDDGLFDVCFIRRLSLAGLLRHLPKVLRGVHTRIKQVTMFRASQVVVESPQELFCHLDGELVYPSDPHRLEVRLIPSALQVLFPV